MNKDWKDALSALRANLGEPEAATSQDTDVEAAENKIIQKSPIKVVVDKKGRNGKIATIIEGFEIPQAEVEEIAKNLKKKLGVGGSVREGEILIQGNHKDAVSNYLKGMKFSIR